MDLDIRFCNSHPVEDTQIYLIIPINDKDGNIIKKVSEKIIINNVPIPQGKNSFMTPPQRP